MKLKKLKIRNFRCYKIETAIEFEDITAIVGKNDSGKSTLLEALDIFLNDGAPDKDDASKNGDTKDLTITCVFDDLPSKIVLDDSYETSLSEEFLLNTAGDLEIIKTYSGNAQTPKCIYLAARAVHPTESRVAKLLQLKNKDLKALAKELDADLAGIDQKVNQQLRAAIRKKVGELQLSEVEVPLLEENGKDVWTSLRSYIPSFALFKSDRSSTDQDPEAQEPLKAVIKEAIKAQSQQLEQIASFVETEVRKIASATLDKIKQMDPELASELNPQFTQPKWDSLFKASLTGDENIPINKRGSGVKRLVLLNFFRAKAEQQIKENRTGGVIYGIEEPETSQHPNNQRMLLRALVDLSISEQIIVTTHTPMLARSLPESKLRYIQKTQNGQREIVQAASSNSSLFAKSLGVLPDNNVKLFIAVEGPMDIAFLQAVSRNLKNEGVTRLDLEKMEIDGEVIFFPLGGSTLALWSSKLANLSRPEFHLYDRDTEPPKPAKYQAHVDEVNKRGKCVAQVTGKLEIENYISGSLVRAHYATLNIPITVPDLFSDFDNVPELVAMAVHSASGSPHAWDSLGEDDRKKKESKVKKNLCQTVARMMTGAELKKTDPKGDVVGWFQTMEKLIEAGT